MAASAGWASRILGISLLSPASSWVRMFNVSASPPILRSVRYAIASRALCRIEEHSFRICGLLSFDASCGTRVGSSAICAAALFHARASGNVGGAIADLPFPLSRNGCSGWPEDSYTGDTGIASTAFGIAG
jgi:hypothetical protein